MIKISRSSAAHVHDLITAVKSSSSPVFVPKVLIGPSELDQHIMNFGAPNDLCTSITEAKHVKAVKEPSRRLLLAMAPSPHPRRHPQTRERASRCRIM